MRTGKYLDSRTEIRLSSALPCYGQINIKKTTLKMKWSCKRKRQLMQDFL